MKTSVNRPVVSPWSWWRLATAHPAARGAMIAVRPALGLAHLIVLAHLISVASGWAIGHPTSLRARLPSATMSISEPGGALTLLGGALARSDAAENSRDWQRVGNQWLRLPPSTPWAVVHFVGGAGLGSAPQLCYDALWADVCDRANVAVIATPYDVAPDHAQLAAECMAGFESARAEACELGLLPAAAPVFRAGHSLGAKLLVVEACRVAGEAGEAGDEVYTGSAPAPLGLLAYNNFGVADSVRLASSVVQTMQGGGARAGRHGQSATLGSSTAELSLLAALQLGSRACSERAWRLRAARHSQGEAGPLGAQPLPRLLGSAALQSRRFHGFRSCRRDARPPRSPTPSPSRSKWAARAASTSSSRPRPPSCRPGWRPPTPRPPRASSASRRATGR